MKTLKQSVNEILKGKGLTKKELCQSIGMTENGLAYSLENETLKVSQLRKISESLKVPIQIFLNSDKNKQITNQNQLQDMEKFTSDNYVLRSDLNYEREIHTDLIKSLKKNVELLEGRIDFQQTAG